MEILNSLRVPSSSPSVSFIFRDLHGPVTALPYAQGVAQQFLNFASSAESVGRFWFRESSQVVIKGNFHSLVGTKAVGSSGNHSDFVVETLNGAIGDFSFGSKPIQDQRLMGA